MEQKADEIKNIHDGHRQRVREKYLRFGIDSFNDHEILEMLLFYCFSRKDTNELAHLLLNSFGSLNGVFSASVEDLCAVSGIGESAATLIHLVSDIAIKRSQCKDEREALDSTEKIGRYIMPFFTAMQNECVIVVALNQKLRVIRTIKVYEGGFDSVSLPVAKIARTLVSCGAYAAVIAHNHPSGIALPSIADLRSTEMVKTALQGVGIQFVDHIIAGDKDFVSLRDSGGKNYAMK